MILLTPVALDICQLCNDKESIMRKTDSGLVFLSLPDSLLTAISKY